MLAQKAQWNVTSHLFPGGSPMQEFSRGWSYTSTDYEADGNKRGERFVKCDEDAASYAAALRQGGHNCVQLVYVWW